MDCCDSSLLMKVERATPSPLSPPGPPVPSPSPGSKHPVREKLVLLLASSVFPGRNFPRVFQEWMQKWGKSLLARDLHMGLSCEMSSSLVHSFFSPHRVTLLAITSLLSSG